MRILLKKNNHMLRSNLRRKWSTSCFPMRVNSPSLYIPRCHGSRPETAAGSKLLLKRFCEESSKYEFTLLSPENLSSHNYCSFENPWLERYAEFAPTCNGLLYAYNNSGDAGVWNPSTAEALELPCHRRSETTTVDASAFGFDSKSRDYKVVRFVDSCVGAIKEKEEAGPTIGVELYSFKSNSWKWIREGVVFDFSSPPVCVDGRAYWLCKGGFILMFDFGDESLSCIDLPPTGKILDGRSFVLDLVEFDGSLGAIVYPRAGTRDPCDLYSRARKSFEVWVTTGGGVWSKEVIVPPCMARRPMGLWRNSQFIFESEHYGLLLYDLHTNEFIEHATIRCTSGNDKYIPYVESMLPIEDQLQGFKSLPWSWELVQGIFWMIIAVLVCLELFDKLDLM